MTDTPVSGSPSLDQLLEGKPLAEQQRELTRLFFTDRAKYDQPDTQAALGRIMEQRIARGELFDPEKYEL